MADKIDLRIGNAHDTVAALVEAGEKFDMAFIDADKGGYDFYYESVLKMMKPGGLIAFDNMIWGGAVADLSNNERDTVALRNLNAKIIKDDRVDACLLSIADGIMLAHLR